MPVDVLARHPAQLAAAEALGVGGTANCPSPVAVDAAGTGPWMEQAVRGADRGGRIMLVALPWEPVPITTALMVKELDVWSAIFYTHADFETAAQFLARDLEVPGQLVTNRFFPRTSPWRSRSPPPHGGAIKVHLVPWPPDGRLCWVDGSSSPGHERSRVLPRTRRRWRPSATRALPSTTTVGQVTT
jgi:hypothetical protein